MTLRRRMAPVIALALLLGQSAWHCAWAEGPGGPAKKLARSACDHGVFRVVVDVGHTAESPGAPSARGFWEYDFNLRLATLIKQKLLAAGFAKTVLLVTDVPARKSLFPRVPRANPSSAERKSLSGAAVNASVDGFCVIRRPRNPDRVASPAGAAAKQTPSPDATAQPANTATAR